MNDGEFDNSGGGGIGGGPVAVAAAAALAVVAVDDRDGIQWRQLQGPLMAVAALVGPFDGDGVGQQQGGGEVQTQQSN